MNSKWLYFSFLLLGFTACEQTKKLEMTIVSFSKMDKLSAELMELALPLTKNDSCEANFVCDATLERPNTKTHQSLFPEGVGSAQQKMGVKFSKIIETRKKFLSDCILEKAFKSELNADPMTLLTAYLKANEGTPVFVLGRGFDFNGKAMTSADKAIELKQKIVATICTENAPKVIVIVGFPTVQSGTHDTLGTVPPPVPPPTSENAALSSALDGIGTSKFSFEQRTNLITPTLNQFFASKSFVRVVGNHGTFVRNQTAKQYLDEICGFVTLERIEILEIKKDAQGKVENLIVKEHHSTKYSK